MKQKDGRRSVGEIVGKNPGFRKRKLSSSMIFTPVLSVRTRESARLRILENNKNFLHLGFRHQTRKHQTSPIGKLPRKTIQFIGTVFSIEKERFYSPIVNFF